MSGISGGLAVCCFAVVMALSACVPRARDPARPPSANVVVVVSEAHPGVGTSPAIFAGETLLVERLTKAGFRVIHGTPGAPGELNSSTLRSGTDEGARLRLRLSGTAGADRIVVLFVTTDENDTSALPEAARRFVSWNATVRIEAMDVQSGMVLAAAMATKPGMGLSKDVASLKAIEKAMDAVLGIQASGEEAPFLRDLRAGGNR